MITCLMWGRSGVVSSILGTFPCHHDWRNWSSFTPRGSPFSCHILLNCSNICPLIISDGPKLIAVWLLHGDFSPSVQYSLSTRIVGKEESKSARSFNNNRRAGNSSHGSVSVLASLLDSIPVTSSSKQARLLFFLFLFALLLHFFLESPSSPSQNLYQCYEVQIW